MREEVSVLLLLSCKCLVLFWRVLQHINSAEVIWHQRRIWSVKDWKEELYKTHVGKTVKWRPFYNMQQSYTTPRTTKVPLNQVYCIFFLHCFRWPRNWTCTTKLEPYPQDAKVVTLWTIWMKIFTNKALRLLSADDIIKKSYPAKGSRKTWCRSTKVWNVPFYQKICFTFWKWIVQSH